MTPFTSPLARVKWLLSANSSAVRVPRAIVDRHSKRYTGDKAHLISRYYIQSIYDSHFYLITWHDDNGHECQKRMKKHTIIAWVQATDGTRPPNADYNTPMLTLAEACQLYDYTSTFLRNKLAKMDAETLARWTERTTGDRWLIHPDFAREIFNDYVKYNNGRGGK